MAKRKRNVDVHFYLSDAEYDILKQRMADAGVANRETYLRTMALEGHIVRINMNELRDISRLIANATNNINQIAKRANETRSIYAGDIQRLQEAVNHIGEQMHVVRKMGIKLREAYNA